MLLSPRVRKLLLWPAVPLAVASSLVACLLAPLRASAVEADPTVLAGTVYLPDGVMPAPAAAVDLMLADPLTGRPVAGSAFARGVSGVDGRFTVNPPEREDLVAQARANGGTLPVAIEVGKLAPHGSIDPNASGPDPLTGKTAVNPDVAYAVRNTVMTLVEVQTGGNPVVDFAFVDPNPAGLALAIVLTVARTAVETVPILGKFTDPDLVSGHEDLDDPDLIPPLGAILHVDEVSEASATQPTAIDPLEEGSADLLDKYIDGSSGPLLTPAEPNGGSPPPGCKVAQTYLLPADGTKRPEGVKYQATLQLHRCTNDTDPDRDYWFWGWKGRIRDLSEGNTFYSVWRYKFRTELPRDDAGYRWIDTDPDVKRSAGGAWTLHWNVGIPGIATLEGSYTVRQAKKIHPFQDWDPRKLYHVSWISNRTYGSSGEDFWNGGGMAFATRNGEPTATVACATRKEIYIWRCVDYRYSDYKPKCDPH